MIKNWNKFWFEERSRQSLCILRIFFGTVFFFRMTEFQNLQYILNIDFDFPAHQYPEPIHYIFRGFRNPVPGFEWLPVPSLSQFHLIEEMLMVASVFFVVGLFTRFFGLFISLTYTYLFLLSQFSYYHHKLQFVTVLLILAFSTCNQFYSLDSLIFKKDKNKRKILPLRLIGVFLSIIYFFSFIQKINYPWLSGDIMLMFLHQGSIQGNFSEIVNSILPVGTLRDLFYRSLGPFTLFAEGLLVFGLWVPRLRRFTLLVGVMLHTGIDLTMSVATFSFQMMASYIVFICPESYQNSVYYDSENKRHRLFVQTGRIFDWFQRIKWVDYNSDEFVNTGIRSTDRLQFSALGKRPVSGIRLIYCVMSLFPVTFVFSFVLGFYLFLKKQIELKTS